MQKELISVIVPIFNNKKFLTRCINSILTQTYKNIEVLLIDDGSNDGSSEICDKYTFIDSRIKVYHIKNSGVSTARNYGLDNVKGKYVCFVDSDDYIDNKYVEILYNNLISSGSDISICGHNIVFEDKFKKFYPWNKKFISTNNCLDMLISHKYFKGHVWDKMYKYDLIKDIRFSSDLSYYEDLYFNYQVFKKVEKIIYDSKSLYYYYKNENSSMNCKYNRGKLSFIKICDEIKEYYIENNYNLKYVNSLTDYLYICTSNDFAVKFSSEYLNDYNKLIYYIRKNIFRIIFKDKISYKHKFAALVMSINKKLYILIRKI